MTGFYRGIREREEKATKNIRGKRMGERGKWMGERDRGWEKRARGLKEKKHMEFPGGPVVRTQCLYCWDPTLMPG